MWKLKTQTDIHTHAHAHAHARTHRQGSSWDKIFSPEMTEYKKYDTALIANVNNHQHFKIESRSKHIVWIYLSSTQTEEQQNGLQTKKWHTMDPHN